jgi:hypothetical protein
MRPRLLISVLAVVALGLAPAEASAAKRTCSLKGSKTVASNSTARVFTVASRRADYGNVLYGCLRSVGRRVRLAEDYDDGLYQTSSFDKVGLNSRFVVWRSTDTDVSCKAACPPDYTGSSVSIEVGDLRRKRVATFAGSPKDALFVGRAGTPAWLQDGVGGVQVYAGDQVLDTGAIDSLSLSGATLSWVNGGVSKSAPLR